MIQLRTRADRSKATAAVPSPSASPDATGVPDHAAMSDPAAVSAEVDGGREIAWDLIRLLAIAFVVYIHVSATALSPSRGLGDPEWLFTSNRLARFAVPAFVFITGSLVWGRTWRVGKGAYRSFMARRIGVVLVPYLMWSGIYLALRPLLLDDPVPDGVWALLAHVFRALITGESWYHLYFVPLIMVVYALTPLAARLAKRSPEALLLLGMLLLQWGPDVFRAVGRPSSLSELGVTVSLYTIYASFGAWFARRRYLIEPALRWAGPALLVGGLTLWARQIEGQLLTPIEVRTLLGGVRTSVVVLGLAGTMLALSRLRFLRSQSASVRTGWLASLVYGVYLAHPLPLLLFSRAVDAGGTSAMWASPIALVGLTTGLLVVVFAAVTGARRLRLDGWLI